MIYRTLTTTYTYVHNGLTFIGMIIAVYSKVPDKNATIRKYVIHLCFT